MRLGQRVKGFFHRIGKGIKSGAKWVAEKGGKMISGIHNTVLAAGAKLGGLIGGGLQAVASKLSGDG